MKPKPLKKLKKWVGKPSESDCIRSFKTEQKIEEAFDSVVRGTCRVGLNQIVGSVGRYHDFDGRFHPKRHLPPERYKNIKEAMRQGRVMPPVKLYQIKDEFYVLDGNHRIAAAKALGHDEIRAKIFEFIPTRNSLTNLIYRERAEFTEKTGLAHPIKLTESGQYANLLNQIEVHLKHLSEAQNKTITFKEAAADWYRTIYRPLLGIIRKGQLIGHFENRTLDDLYAYISYHQWERGRRRAYGIGIDRLIPRDMEAFRDKMAKKSESEYPEMLQEITAFVLMNVRTKDENRIMKKLFSVPEIKEIHLVHGSMDFLIKITLTRDLLTSDAEIISQFVSNNISKTTGVVSTQTLIPGKSMIK